MITALDITRINIYSPYKIWSDGDIYRFETDHGIKYLVDFDLDANPYYTAYWFNLSNPEHTKSPGDKKIAQTVVCIIEEFFRVNPNVLLYMCSTDNDQQAQRARLFLRWFNGAEQQQKYVIVATEVKGEIKKGKRLTEYIAMIVPRNHPKLDEIIDRFNEEVKMFNEFKP